MFSSAPKVINSKEEDAFGHYDKIEFIRKFIEDNIKDWWFLTNEYDRMIALYGWWWSGKSTIMKTLCESRDVALCLDVWTIKPIIFEAWKYEGDDNLWLSLLLFLISHLSIKDIESEIYEMMCKVFLWFTAATSFEVGNEGWKFKFEPKELIAEVSKDDSLTHDFYSNQEKLKNWFKQLTSSIDEKVVIFIDDLDRCESDNVIELLTAIKLFFTYAEDIVFIAWVDKQAVTRALKSKYNNDDEKAEEYLEKIFPINFSCDVIDDISKLIEKSTIEDVQLKKQIQELVNTIWFNNPRHLQRYLNKWEIIEKMWSQKLTGNEKDYEIFLYCWYAYLFEFERELFDKTVNIKKKKDSYISRIISYTNSNNDVLWFSQNIRITELERYLIPYAKTWQANTFRVPKMREWINCMTNLKNHWLWSNLENSVFEHLVWKWWMMRKYLYLDNFTHIDSVEYKKKELMNSLINWINFQSIITTIQTIF